MFSLLFFVFYCQCLIRSCGRKYLRIHFPASKCRKDLLESVSFVFKTPKLMAAKLFFELLAGSQAFNNTGSLLALLLVFPSHAHIIYLDSEYLNICVQSVKCGNYFLKQSLLFLNTSLELKEISTCLQDLPVIRKPHLPKVHVK